MDCMESDHDEPLFMNHIIVAQVSFAKNSWIKKIDFGNKYYGVVELKLGFFDRRFDTRKVSLKNTEPTLKHGGRSMMFSECFNSRRTEQLIAIRRKLNSED